MNFILLLITFTVTILSLLLQSQQSAYSQNEPETLPIYYDGLVNATISQPSNWFFETKGLEYSYVTALYPTEFIAQRNPPVSFNIAISLPAKGNASLANLSAYADAIQSVAQTQPDIRVINFTRDANVSIANGTETIPAFVLYSYDFSRPFVDSQRIDVGTIINDEYTIGFEYDATTEYFNKYLSQFESMIESFEMIQVRNATETTMAME